MHRLDLQKAKAYHSFVFFVVETPTPVLNTADFSFAFGGKSGSEISTDEKGLCRFVEFVALPGMSFSIEETLAPIYRISTPHYPSEALYIDSRFGTLSSTSRPFPSQLPPHETILSRMQALLGKPYIWGGNWSAGIPQMLSLYPPKKPVDRAMSTLWTLAGVDCSGLLFEATRGATPRNTRMLLQYGAPLNIEHLPLEQMLPLLRPLDMIVYPGHVFFVLDEKHTIESRFPFGVIQRDLKERFKELLHSQFSFLIRRSF